MSQKVLVVAVLLVAVLLELAADILCKEWALKHAPVLIAGGVLSYGVATQSCGPFLSGMSCCITRHTIEQDRREN